MDDKLRQLTAKKQKLDSLKPLPPQLAQNLDEWFNVELTYSSNAIEGNTLSRIETAEVLERGVTAVISGKPLKDQLEAINHSKGLEFIKKLAEQRKGHQFITMDDILAIQKIILTGINDEWAGVYRQTEIFVRGSNAQFPPPSQVYRLMKQFVIWLQGQQETHPVRVAADAHFKLVNIHPFQDGNGRTARLLMNLILIMHEYPMAVIRNEDRTAYLSTFDIVRESSDLTPFYSIIYDAVDRSLDIYLEALEPERKSIPKPTLEQRFYTTDEVAKILKVDPESIRRYVRSGKLKAVKLGGKLIRIEKADLHSFIESSKT